MNGDRICANASKGERLPMTDVSCRCSSYPFASRQ